MARQRKYDLDKQTHFAKTHRELMKGHYMTDMDSIQIINTENQLYNQYTYINGVPIIQRLIEVKSRMTKFIKYIFEGKTKPNPQIKSQAYMVAELNAFRKQTNYPLMDYWFVIEDEGEYPYEIWKVTTTFGTGEIHFKQIGEVMNDTEYKAFFTIT